MKIRTCSDFINEANLEEDDEMSSLLPDKLKHIFLKNKKEKVESKSDLDPYGEEDWEGDSDKKGPHGPGTQDLLASIKRQRASILRNEEDKRKYEIKKRRAGNLDITDMDDEKKKRLEDLLNPLKDRPKKEKKPEPRQGIAPAGGGRSFSGTHDPFGMPTMKKKGISQKEKDLLQSLYNYYAGEEKNVGSKIGVGDKVTYNHPGSKFHDKTGYVREIRNGGACKVRFDDRIDGKLVLLTSSPYHLIKIEEEKPKDFSKLYKVLNLMVAEGDLSQDAVDIFTKDIEAKNKRKILDPYDEENWDDDDSSIIKPQRRRFGGDQFKGQHVNSVQDSPC